MTFPAATISPRRRALYGVAAVVAVGTAGVAGWAYARHRSRVDLVRQLARYTGNEGIDPDRVGFRVALAEIELTFNVGSGDGKWSDETEALIRRLLADPEFKAKPAENPAPADPTVELEPEGDWTAAYEDGIEGAVEQAKLDPQVVTFDQALIYVLVVLFPEAGAFHSNPDMGPWKYRAREHARADLIRRLGSTEAEARAALNARTVGASALQHGLGLGQAVRAMGQYAFPTATWEGPRSRWQEVFSDQAARELRAMSA